MENNLSKEFFLVGNCLSKLQRHSYYVMGIRHSTTSVGQKRLYRLTQAEL